MAIDKIISASITDGTIATADIADGAVTSVKTTGVGGANTPCFRAYLNSTLSLGNGADTTLVYNAESFDPQSTFDTSTGRFTPGVSGKFFLKATILLADTGDGKILEMYIRKNSSTISAYRMRGSAATNMHVEISDVVESDADDYFYIQFYHNIGNSVNATSGENQTFFTGYKIIT